VLSILCICGDHCVQSVMCVRVLVFHLGGVVFGGSVRIDIDRLYSAITAALRLYW